ncbi:hypothetical protein SAMN05720470_101517 [Fibrobacter sp. UWOV1]|uniref:hypothetical protein n=1 Tax=Fibrobacter sp. UWOV1 TaxID=1896215 RepID=UPI00090F3D48|nr:hypothetical protein [Fibrobacter sp. UWOV1]SHK48851.1 hypothetical protein SAMN05720470_101517 [Fibrobacter sp. UWOV1]
MEFTKFLFAGAFCACTLATSLHATECSYEPPVRESGSTGAYFEYPAVSLYLFEGSYLDLSKMDQRDPTVKNVSGTDTIWMYRSELDSTMIVIASEKVVKVARVAYSDNQDDFVDSLFSVHHDAVFKDEFARLQKAGVFKGTAEQADSLVNHVFELCGRYYWKEGGYSGCEFNPPELRRRNDGKDIDKADVPLASSAVAGIHAFLLDTLNFCPDYRFAADTITTTIAPKFSQANASFTKLSQNRYQIAGARPNSPYKAFSLNGQLIESGILNNGVFSAKKLPVILMLNDGRSIYLKD